MTTPLTAVPVTIETRIEPTIFASLSAQRGNREGFADNERFEVDMVRSSKELVTLTMRASLGAIENTPVDVEVPVILFKSLPQLLERLVLLGARHALLATDLEDVDQRHTESIP